MNQGAIGSASIGTTAVQVLSANPRRMAITFFFLGAGTLTISDRTDVASGVGIVVRGATLPTYLSHDLVGDLLTKTLYAISTTGTVLVSWVEVLCPCHNPPLAP